MISSSQLMDQVHVDLDLGLKQQNVQNPLGRARKPNFISKHKVILHCSKICCIPVYQLHL